MYTHEKTHEVKATDTEKVSVKVIYPVFETMEDIVGYFPSESEIAAAITAGVTVAIQKQMKGAVDKATAAISAVAKAIDALKKAVPGLDEAQAKTLLASNPEIQKSLEVPSDLSLSGEKFNPDWEFTDPEAKRGRKGK